MKTKLKITIVGSGYVGMSLAILFSQENDVVVLDVEPSRVRKIKAKQSTIDNKEMEDFLDKKNLCITATLDKKSAYRDASFIVVATPTNYNPDTNQFDTRSVDETVDDALKFNSNGLVVIKSTVPVGHTKLLQERFNTNRIIFSPEFLREDKALEDNLFPSRIIIGGEHKAGKEFSELLVNFSKKNNTEVLFVSSTEAEAVKLFANTYLAMRVSFFNELDSFALTHNLNAENIINGVCLDERIGGGYNNPSFGYGGYCLPKDTKQLLASYNNIPQDLIEAIVSSNSTRKNFIAEEILKLNPKTVGFYRMVMKEGSDNFRSSAIIGVMERIKQTGIDIIVYEPKIKSNNFLGSKVISSLDKFKLKCDVIVANRMADCLNDVSSKCFTRDLFGCD